MRSGLSAKGETLVGAARPDSPPDGDARQDPELHSINGVCFRSSPASVWDLWPFIVAVL
jgi:hypothetical protein